MDFKVKPVTTLDIAWQFSMSFFEITDIVCKLCQNFIISNATNFEPRHKYNWTKWNNGMKIITVR